MAPPSKLTPALVDKICQQVAAGMSLRGAFRTVGAPPRDRTALAAGQWFTVRIGFAWMETGRKLLAAFEQGAREPAGLSEHEELCVDLVLRVEQGLGLQEAHWVGKLQSGQGRDAGRWQWLLERKFPDEYKAQQRVEVTGGANGPVAVEVASTTPGALHARLAALAARAVGGVDPGAAGDPDGGGTG